jgi:gentisate 1,2-dioxygenase
MKAKIFFEYEGVGYTLVDFSDGVIIPQIGAQIEFLPNGASTNVQQRITDVIYFYDQGPGNYLTATLTLE